MRELIWLIVRGLYLGLLVTGVAVVWSMVSRRRGGPAPAVGLLIAVAFLIGDGAPWISWVAILFFAASGLMSSSPKWTGVAIRTFLIGSGAVLLALSSIQAKHLWLRTLIVPGTLYLTHAIVQMNRRDPGFPQLFLAMTVAGILMIVPDTEEAALLLGILLPTMLLAGPLPLASPGREGTAPLAGLLAWMICTGGQGRPASVLASVGCLGLLAIEPLVPASHAMRVIRVLLQCLSITIVLAFARTTGDLQRAGIVTLAALGFPAVFLFVSRFFRSQNPEN